MFEQAKEAGEEVLWLVLCMLEYAGKMPVTGFLYIQACRNIP